MREKITKVICDTCNNEIDEFGKKIFISQNEFEEISEVVFLNNKKIIKEIELCNIDFCSIECFLKYLRNKLTGKTK